MSDFDQEIGTGALPDPVDDRDFLYEPVLGAPDTEPVNWDEGYDAFKALEIPVIKQDQDGSLSCTGQAVKAYVRNVLKSLGVAAEELSARDVYSHVYLPGGGAYIRDAVMFAATRGILKHAKATDYDSGNPPSEMFMRIRTRNGDPDEQEGKQLDKFNARMIVGSTANIDTFAHAIRNFHGVVGGFTGTNPGWARASVRPPAQGEQQWGHCVYISAFGKLDLIVDDLPQGTKCLFTPNSWGGRYTISSGRWKGYQAIPEKYFTDNGGLTDPATGLPAVGVHVFNSWVLVPDSAVSPDQQTLDFLKRNQNKIVQLTQPGIPGSGGFKGIIVGDELRTVNIEKPTEPEKLIFTALVRNGFGVGVPKAMLDKLPKKPL